VNVAMAVRALYPDGITTIIDVANEKDALTELGSVVRSGGRVVSLVGAADVDDFAARGVTAANVMAVPTVEKLQRLGEMATSGQLTIPIEATYSLDQIEEALAAFREGKRGKLIIRP
jgi:NADPH:quinone reductase-like Zn-dependent oxidoreductase